MTAVEVLLGELLLRIVPDAVIWGLFGLFGIVILLTVWRSPAPVSGHLMFLFVWTMSTYLGGVFLLINYLMLAGTGVALWLAVNNAIQR